MAQAGLYGETRFMTALKEQDLFSLPRARAAREAGKDLVEEHGESFVEVMRREAIRIAQEKGAVTCDDLRGYAAARGFYPRHQNTWGSIFRGPEWKSAGFIQSRLVSNHARIIRIWKYEPNPI